MDDRDPVFDLPPPLLFAHRGGAREKPESTEVAFRWAVDQACAEVLEIDVQLTKDEIPVLWHGPDLDNVLIEGHSSDIRKRKRLRKRQIGEFNWKELDDKAWVADPHDDPKHKFSAEELEAVPKDSERTLLRLEEFLKAFVDQHLNIEIKPQTFDPRTVETLAAVLDRNWSNHRRILVTSRKKDLLAAFRACSSKDFPTGYSFWEVISMAFRAALPISFDDMTNRALQTSHIRILSSRKLIAKVKEAKGAVHVFLTGFCPIRGKDELPGTPSREHLEKILKRGMHGVMTDRPNRVRRLMSER